jgi:hypothetical protein
VMHCYIAWMHVVQSKFTRWQHDCTMWCTIANGDILILQSACSTIIVGGWIIVRYLLHTTWPWFCFIPKHSRHICSTLTTFLKVFRAQGQPGQRQWCSYTIPTYRDDHLTRMRSHKSPRKIRKKFTKTLL